MSWQLEATVTLMSATLPIGIDDFRALREQGMTYVDKTHIVCELIDRPGAQVVFLPRPRRFGKSLALSMLRCFFDRQGDDLGHLFHDLAVWRAGERYRAHFRRYPVIHLGFKDLERARWDELQWAVREKIRDLFDEHRALLEAGAPSALDRERFAAILDGSAPPGLYRRALLDLSRALHRAHGEKVVLLIDDCDLPLHAAHAHGYGREAQELLAGLLAAGLDGNPHLARAVLTGATGATRDRLLPGNAAVYSVLRSELATGFGFTAGEVDSLLAHGQAERDARAQRALLERWYGGYRFGEHDIYNPWSVLSFLADPRARARPYWHRTGGRDLARQVLEGAIARVEPLLGPLLAGDTVSCALDDGVPLDPLAHGREAVWSLLVACGWLCAVERPAGDASGADLPEHALRVPNHEVSLLLRELLAQQQRQVPDPVRPAIAPADVTDDDGIADIESARAELASRTLARRAERDQALSPRERRPDILADADAFEERLQSFLDEMRAAAAPTVAAPPDDARDVEPDHSAT